MPTRTGTQSIDRASQLLVHVVEEDDAPTVGELAQRRAAEEHDLAARRCARAPGARAARPVRRRDQPGAGAAALRAPRDRRVPISSSSPAEALERLAGRAARRPTSASPTSTAVEMLDQRDSRHIVGSTNWVGRRVPPHGSVVGKVFLAEGALPVPVRAARAARPADDHRSGRAAPRSRADAGPRLRDRGRRARGRPLVGGRSRARRRRRRRRRAERLRPDRSSPRRPARRARPPRTGRGLYPV